MCCKLFLINSLFSDINFPGMDGNPPVKILAGSPSQWRSMQSKNLTPLPNIFLTPLPNIFWHCCQIFFPRRIIFTLKILAIHTLASDCRRYFMSLLRLRICDVRRLAIFSVNWSFVAITALKYRQNWIITSPFIFIFTNLPFNHVKQNWTFFIIVYFIKIFDRRLLLDLSQLKVLTCFWLSKNTLNSWTSQN